MKILGTEGMDAPTVRQEVERGARFVLYTYCISLVVVTLKRPSNISFLRPGQSPVIKGLPFVLVSLLLGWWGFPWGPIYTVQCLVNDLLGGKDVTNDILASLAWRHPARRAAYADLARRMNFDPAFPHLIIDQATAAPGRHR